MPWNQLKLLWMSAALALGSGCVRQNGEMCVNSGVVCFFPATCDPAGQKCIHTCGDGVHDQDEECDDGNKASGDGCSETCKVESGRTCGDGGVPQISMASGSIEAVSGGAAVDGELFTLNDGSTRTTFEVDIDNSSGAGNIPIRINGGDSAETVASRIGSEVARATGAGLQIVATSSSRWVYLINTQPGAGGNHELLHSEPHALTYIGMSGGAGRDCPAGTGCTSNDDCASRSCDAGVCGAGP